MTGILEPVLTVPDLIAPRAAGSNTPLFLNDPTMAWEVAHEGMDIFAVPLRNGEIDGPRQFLFEVPPGTLLLGAGYDARGRTTLMAVGRGACTVSPISLDALRQRSMEHPDALAEQLEPMVSGIASAVGSLVRPRVPLDVVLDEHAIEEIQPGRRVGVHHGIQWIEVTHRGLHLLDGECGSIGASDPCFPLAPGAWLLADEEGGRPRIRCHDTAQMLADGRAWPALAAYLRFSVEWASGARLNEERRRLQLLRDRQEGDSDARDAAVSGIAGVMHRDVTPATGARRGAAQRRPLLDALDLVGGAQQFTFVQPADSWVASDPFTAAQVIADRSAIGVRRVRLEGSWWQQEGPPLLGALELRSNTSSEATSTTRRGSATSMELVPVALLPERAGGYVLVNPEDGTRSPLDANVARLLSTHALQFYRGLPTSAVTLGDLWRFVTRGVTHDAGILLLLGAIGAVLGLFMPLLTAALFDDVIPSADRNGLMAMGIALVTATASGTLFEVTRNAVVTRLHTRVTSSLQLAVLHRLVALPARFFRDYSVGDLGQRAMGIHRIGLALGEQTLSVILGSLSGLFALALLLRYSPALTLVSVLIVALTVLLSAVSTRRIIRQSRREQELGGALSGLLLELLRGIAKLRVAAAESRAFARWSAIVQEQQRVGFAGAVFGLQMSAVDAMLQMVSTALTFGAYGWLASQSASSLTTGQFLAFSAAQGSFIAAALSLAGTVLSLAGLLPTWERVRPLLVARPESDGWRADPGVLSGQIEVQHLHFAYAADGPAILHDVSLTIRPGMFVALVGPSGSGKSTLLRLLLGFEQPGAGAIRFDGQELASLDPGAVRRQIGVVLQSATLNAGDIFSNIAGSSACTMDDVWAAARMAGLEADLRAMPMGVHTVVSEGGGTLSGGQRQRLLIARALVHRPRILVFDEATSALDNNTQRIVSESLERLHATRIVVAHRLSTVREADLIVVLKDGRIVEQGTYETLAAAGGLFASMAARQDA
jgi:NHLM bacteriocin system ABC transporter ATP-binding protein